MDVKLVLTLLAGVVAGAAVVSVIMALSAPRMMIVEDPSRLGFQATVDRIVAEAEAQGWSVPTVHHIDQTLAKKGFQVRSTTVIELCKPDLAATILDDEPSRKVASMMPCRIAVYERDNGSVTVSRMNTGLVSKLFGGLIARIMARATGDSERILATVL